jgi:hypothetical protein
MSKVSALRWFFSLASVSWISIISVVPGACVFPACAITPAVSGRKKLLSARATPTILWIRICIVFAAESRSHRYFRLPMKLYAFSLWERHLMAAVAFGEGRLPR